MSATKTDAQYEAGKARALLHSRSSSEAARDIGKPPKVASPSRRRRAIASLEFFLRTYFPQAFRLAFSPDHLDVIAALQSVATSGGLYAIAMPRGSGKTTIVVRAALWAILTGRRRFVAVVSSTDTAAQKIIRSLKTELTWNAKLYGDFPRELHGIPQLQGDNRRAGGQLCDGEKTEIKMGTTELIFPTIAKSTTSGAIVSATGLTGNVRGQFHTRKTGEIIRPDLAILDDPQTKESARSLAQTVERIEIIEGDVLGMAGPDQTIAAVMPCTVIEEDDLADRVLKAPTWHGKRTKTLYEFPADMEWWESYFQLRQTDADAAAAKYREERDKADAGAVVAWPERKVATDDSALQTAMHLWWQSPTAFAAEYQNEPAAKVAADKDLLTADRIASKLNNIPRGVVPAELHVLTAYVDVQQDVLYWLVAAWGQHFSGAVVDYGCFPDQARENFALVDVRNKLRDRYPGTGLEGWLYAGLGELTATLLNREWKRAGDAGVQRIQRLLIDARWGLSTNVVFQFARQSPHSSVLLPSFGRGVKADDAPIESWKEKPGERKGHNWMIRRDAARAIPHVTLDTNYWKSFVQTRLSTATGDRGSLTLCGDTPAAHKMLADHLTAEFRVVTQGRGRTVDVWKQRAERPDNHWLDCLTGCAAAASIEGVTVEEWAPARKRARPLTESERKPKVRMRMPDGRAFFITDRGN